MFALGGFWGVGDGSVQPGGKLLKGTPRNVWLTRLSHSSLCVKGVYRVSTITHRQRGNVNV